MGRVVEGGSGVSSTGAATGAWTETGIAEAGKMGGMEIKAV